MKQEYAEIAMVDDVEVVINTRRMDALDPSQINQKNGRAVLRPILTEGWDNDATDFGAHTQTWLIGETSVTRQWSVDLAAMQASATERVINAAEATRQKFITAGSGKAMSYDHKAAEAKDCLASYDSESPPAEGTYPLLDSEIGATGEDTLAVAAVVDAKRQSWIAIEAVINRNEVLAKRNIGLAETPAAIVAILAALTWPQPS